MPVLAFALQPPPPPIGTSDPIWLIHYYLGGIMFVFCNVLTAGSSALSYDYISEGISPIKMIYDPSPLGRQFGIWPDHDLIISHSLLHIENAGEQPTVQAINM